MNWEAIGALAELLGALGVIVSLVYLASQIRQNTSAMRGAAHESSTARITNVTTAIGTNPQVSELVARGTRDFTALTDSERLQYRHVVGAILIGAEATYLQYKRGNLEDEIWQRSLATLPMFTVHAGFQAYWARVRDTYTPEFQAVVDDQIAKAKQSAP